ncbi:MAG: Rpn family recombination-promoting nuclease/putative transposase [Byssovorax sp.]
MLPVFADPKTDVVFKRIFGDEARKPLLIALLNDLLELSGPRRIRSVQHFSLEQRVTPPKSKLSIVDVKCTTASGRRFVVEMQVLPVEGFEKRVVYNASKAYVMQIRGGDDYPKLCDVVGVTICNFTLWPTKIKGKGYKVPMLSRWRMQEQKSGHKGLRQVQYAFLELPKYGAGEAPETLIDKWAYFFREAKNLEVVPPALSEGPFREALEVARRSTFTDTEWEEYERAKMAEQDELGRISFAHRQGKIEEAARAVLTVLRVRGITVPDAARERILAEKDPTRLERWLERAALAASIAEVLDESS